MTLEKVTQKDNTTTSNNSVAYKQKMKVHEIIKFINNLMMSPLYIYKMFCNSFTDKTYSLNGKGIGMYLYDIVFENIQIYCTHTHLMLNHKIKFLISQLEFKDKRVIAFMKEKSFMNVKQNDITKRITYNQFKYNERVTIDKLIIIFWFVFYMFKFMPKSYFRIRLLLIDALKYLETTKLCTEKIQKKKMIHTPKIFKHCKNISQLCQCISNPYFYKQIYKYI